MYTHPAHVQIDGKNRHLAGWKHDLPDHRDLLLKMSKMPLVEAAKLPPAAKVEEYGIKIRDQADIGSCTGHGTTYLANHLSHKKGKPFTLSPLYLYYFTRVGYEHVAPTDDSGAQVRSAVKCLAQYGTPVEDLWPYTEHDSKFVVRPNMGAIKNAHKHMALKYVRVSDLQGIKQALVAGYPVVGGFTCYESLDSRQTAKTGYVARPTNNEAVIGGHCIAFTAYDDIKKQVRFVNSWSEAWGDHGYGYLDYWYFDAYQASDFWIITDEMI